VSAAGPQASAAAPSIASYCFRHFAPLRVHEVVQVTFVPFSHCMHTFTHWFMFLRSNGVYSLAAQASVEPVTSELGEHDATVMASDASRKAAVVRMAIARFNLDQPCRDHRRSNNNRNP
jgi:hypothetical protein